MVWRSWRIGASIEETLDGTRGQGVSVLFEPYFNILSFEFNVGVFSVCEGLGAAYYLAGIQNDGANGPRVRAAHWPPALVQRFDPNGQTELANKIAAVKAVRDKLHQDQLGARGDIDWHDFGYQEAFVPAKATLEILLSDNIDLVPRRTNLIELPAEEVNEEEGNP